MQTLVTVVLAAFVSSVAMGSGTFLPPPPPPKPEPKPEVDKECKGDNASSEECKNNEGQ